jgi:hypothetical protein
MDVEAHHGHIVQMKPLFRTVVPGKSDAKRPDWSQAPNPGDQLKDGTVVWENVGQELFCVTCGKTIAQLAAPERKIQ